MSFQGANNKSKFKVSPSAFNIGSKASKPSGAVAGLKRLASTLPKKKSLTSKTATLGIRG